MWVVTGKKFHTARLKVLDESEITEKTKTAIVRCLESDPKDRFADANELYEYMYQKYEADEFKTDSKTPGDFSLDFFDRLYKESIVYVEYLKGQTPSFSRVCDLLENGLPAFIDDNAFLTEQSLTHFLRKLKGFHMCKHKPGKSQVRMSYMKIMARYFKSLGQHDKELFAKTLLTILAQKAHMKYEPPIDPEDIPF